MATTDFQSVALPTELPGQAPGNSTAGRATQGTIGGLLEALADRSAGPLACWPWKGNVDADGFATLAHGGRTYRVPRLVLEGKLRRTLRPRERVEIECGNRWCSNPEHIDRARTSRLGPQPVRAADVRRWRELIDGARGPDGRLTMQAVVQAMAEDVATGRISEARGALLVDRAVEASR